MKGAKGDRTDRLWGRCGVGDFVLSCKICGRDALSVELAVMLPTLVIVIALFNLCVKTL